MPATLKLLKNETWMEKDKYKKIDVSSLPDICANCAYFFMNKVLTSSCANGKTDFSFYEWIGYCLNHKREDN